MITHWGSVSHLTSAVVAAADAIKHLNYKTTTPAKFQKNTLTEDIAKDLMDDISIKIGVDRSKLDYVYFSAARGAEPHVDLLDGNKFEDRTFVIPVILPKGASVLTAEDDNAVAELGHIYEFNHEKTHGMTVEDSESGCVVIMVAIKKN